MCINLPKTNEMGAWSPYSSPSPPHTISLSTRVLELVESNCLQSKQATSRWTSRASQVVLVKICLPMQETQETRVQSLGQEDPLERGMTTHSSIIAWTIPWTEEPGWPQSTGSQRVGHN